MNQENIINQGIKKAQGMKKDWKVGDIVCHLDEPRALEVREIKGGVIKAGWEDIEREFPIDECFNFRDAKRECFRVMAGNN